MIFHWSLSNSKSPEVSGTLLSILDYLNNGVDWMHSICPPISNSSSLFLKPLGTIPRAPIIILLSLIWADHPSSRDVSWVSTSLTPADFSDQLTLTDSSYWWIRAPTTSKKTGNDQLFPVCLLSFPADCLAPCLFKIVRLLCSNSHYPTGLLGLWWLFELVPPS